MLVLFLDEDDKELMKEIKSGRLLFFVGEEIKIKSVSEILMIGAESEVANFVVRNSSELDQQNAILLQRGSSRMICWREDFEIDNDDMIFNFLDYF